jgi:hypothetical protein
VDPSRKPSLRPAPAGGSGRTRNPDGSQAVGRCPACGHDFAVELHEDGPHPSGGSCARCQGAPPLLPESAGRNPLGLSVTYDIAGEWEAAPILEYLFDHVGAVDYLQKGFVCYPDDRQIDCPTIMVDERSRRIRFGLFGYYDLADATAIIHDAAADLAGRFQVDLQPAVLARWQYQERLGGFTLVEHRRLDAWSREPSRRPAHA